MSYHVLPGFTIKFWWGEDSLLCAFIMLHSFLLLWEAESLLAVPFFKTAEVAVLHVTANS